MLNSPPHSRALPVVFLGLYLPVLLLLAAVVVAGETTDISIADVVRDVTSVAEVKIYVGAVSTLGIMLWCAAATVCLLTAAVLHTQTREAEVKGFLFGAGLLTALLMFDDAFLLHEGIVPRFLGEHGGDVMFALYGVSALLLFARWRQVVRQSEVVLLALALGFLALSIGFDKLHDFGLIDPFDNLVDEGGILLEDGSKLLGIAGWFGYFGWTSYAVLTTRDSDHSAGSAQADR